MKLSPVLLLLLALPSSPAAALSLAHDDLVAIGTGDSGAGIYRVDSGTGEQELISAGSFSDVALRGAHRIYATRGDEVVEIDPETGAEQVVASGFSGSLSVAVNPTGDVFVLESEFAGATRLYRVDAAASTTHLIVESTLPAIGDPTSPGIRNVYDLELLDEDTPIALAEGRAFGGSSSSAGVVAFDRWTGSEEVLVSSLDSAAVPDASGGLGTSWIEPTGLGVTADGIVLVACDGDFDCGLWDYDPDTDQLAALGVEDMFGVGTFGQIDWNNVDITSLSDGELFISTGGVRAGLGGDPALSGIHPLAEDACTYCDPDSDLAPVLVDGEAFSAGNWTEIQRVDAQTPVPEPSALPAFALGLAVFSAHARRRRRD